MLADLALPTVLAIVFTAGAYGIHKTERYAERITSILGIAFVMLALLDVLALEGYYAANQHGSASRTAADLAPAQLDLGD